MGASSTRREGEAGEEKREKGGRERSVEAARIGWIALIEWPGGGGAWPLRWGGCRSSSPRCARRPSCQHSAPKYRRRASTCARRHAAAAARVPRRRRNLVRGGSAGLRVPRPPARKCQRPPPRRQSRPAPWKLPEASAAMGRRREAAGRLSSFAASALEAAGRLYRRLLPPTPRGTRSMQLPADTPPTLDAQLHTLRPQLPSKNTKPPTLRIVLAALARRRPPPAPASSRPRRC